MPDTKQNLLSILQLSLRKYASSALPATPKVPNPAPQPLKTPSFTTKPPTVGKVVADVRPGISSTVTPQTQTLGTAKSNNTRQSSVSKPIMAPKEFKAIPTIPLAKTAQQAGVASRPNAAARGTVNRVTGRQVYGSGTYDGADDFMSDWASRSRAIEAAKAKRYAAEQAKANPPQPVNPHYANRPAQVQARVAQQRQARLEDYAKDDPTVVKKMTDAQLASHMKGYRGLGDRIRGLFGQDSSVGDYIHDSANTMEIMANGAQKGLDWAISKGVKWLDPRSWGGSVSALQRRMSYDNDWSNAQRVYDARHEKLVNGMILGDSSDPRARALLDVQRGLGEFAGTSVAMAGAGGALKGVGAGVTALGRGAGSGVGRVLASGAQRLGVSAGRADMLQRGAAGLGEHIGLAASAPVRYAGTALGGVANAPAKTVGGTAHALVHPIRTVRSAVNGVRTVGRVMNNPGQAIRAGWRRGLVGKGLGRGVDAAMYGLNAYDVANGVATGQYGQAGSSALNQGIYTHSRKLPGLLGYALGFGVPLAMGYMIDRNGDGQPEG